MEYDAFTYMQQEFNNAIASAQLDIDHFILQHSLDHLLKNSDPTKVRKALLSIHSGIITELQKIGFPDYCLNVKDKETLFSIFQSQSMEIDSIVDEAALLQKSYTLKGKLTHLEECIYDIDEINGERPARKTFAQNEFMQLCRLLDSLPPDSKLNEIFEEKLSAIDYKFTDSLLPMDDIFDDVMDAFKNHFKELLSALSDKLRNQPRTESFLFIEKKINELKQQELLLSIDDKQLPKWNVLLKSFLELESDYLKEIEKISSNKNFQAVYKCLTQLGKDTSFFLKLDNNDLEIEKSLELTETSKKSLLIERYEQVKERLKERGNFLVIQNINTLEELTEHLLLVYPEEIANNITEGKIFFSDCQEIIDHISSFYDLLLMKNLKQQIETFDQSKKLEPEQVKKTSKEASPKTNSFYYKKYDTNPDAIKNLQSALEKHNFIPVETNKKEFQKIFHNEKPDSPIQWLGNLSELKYFVKLLNNDFKVISDLKNNIWKVTAEIFVDKNNKPFDYSKFRKQQDPAKKDIIQRIAQML